MSYEIQTMRTGSASYCQSLIVLPHSPQLAWHYLCAVACRSMSAFPDNEPAARVRIDALLQTAGWNLLDSDGTRANVRLEAHVRLTQAHLDALGEDYQHRNGKADYLLLDNSGKPLAVLEAKSTGADLLAAKEQARSYAESFRCQFVLLSNGLQHYWWDLRSGNPEPISRFPTPESISTRTNVTPADPQQLVDEPVGSDYIVLAQEPGYKSAGWWQDEAARADEIAARRLRFMRDYQVDAVHAIQRSVADGNTRFLIEMATGTGKTLTAAAIIRLFMDTRNARKVLFLVDRLELENQAERALNEYLGKERSIGVYKRRRDTWPIADVVITTVQSLLVNNRFREWFSPTDFDFVISDEAHRSIAGASRAVFEHFIGYKLGLTATPRDYLRGFVDADKPTTDPTELDRRAFRDTYKTFGCESGVPTYQYALIQGAEDGFLVNPTTVDARTDITTQLLSESGLHATYTDAEGETREGEFSIRDFERDFFSEATNRVFCQTFLEEGLRDPISNEFGKSIIYAVSQRHASELVQILNELANAKWGGRYQSDFAMQVTSSVKDAQQYAQQFANNNLRGIGLLRDYRTSKTRVCVTVGMMTTGYDCPDLLNLGLFRPIFSPTEFIQIKGRGTRKHNFSQQLTDDAMKDVHAHAEKTTFKLFDFFGNFEYFETGHDYDEQLKLPNGITDTGTSEVKDRLTRYVWHGADHLAETTEEVIGPEGMKVDRQLFFRFKTEISSDEVILNAANDEDWEKVADQVIENHFNQPEDYFNLPKLRRALGLDDDVPLREILEFTLERISEVKTRDQRADEAFDQYVIETPDIPPSDAPNIRKYFMAYATNDSVSNAIDKREFQSLGTNPAFTFQDFTSVPNGYRESVPDWIKHNFTRKG